MTYFTKEDIGRVGDYISCHGSELYSNGKIVDVTPNVIVVDFDCYDGVLRTRHFTLDGKSTRSTSFHNKAFEADAGSRFKLHANQLTEDEQLAKTLRSVLKKFNQVEAELDLAVKALNDKGFTVGFDEDEATITKTISL